MNNGIILPSIITGPAVIRWNGKTFYSKNGIEVHFRRETFRVETDGQGTIDERARLQFTEIRFTPDGQVGGLEKYFPYTMDRIGTSIFGTTPLPLVIQTKFGGANNTGQAINYPRAAVSALPVLRLKPTETLFGPMTFTALGMPTIQPTAPNAWQSIVDLAFADTSFDETSLITDTYTASYGASPYDAMGSISGFEFAVAMGTERIVADDYGLVDLILKSMTAGVKFAPVNLTEAQVYALLANQGAGCVLPGQSLSKNNTNLVITGSGNAARTLTVTLNNAGPKQAGFLYDSTRHRFESLEFTSKRTWSNGTAAPLFQLKLV